MIMSNNSQALLPANPETTDPSPEVLEQLNRITSGYRVQQAVSTVCGDFNSRVKNLVEDTENDAAEVESELISFADDLLDFCDDGHSIGFCRLGGLDSLKLLLNYPSEQVRATYLDVLASISQNNEEVQKFVHENSDFVKSFLEKVKTTSQDASVYRSKLLYAISSLVRGSTEGRKIFFDENGVKILEDAFSSSFAADDSRLATRSAVVAHNIYSDTLAAGDVNANNDFNDVLKKMRQTLETKADKYAEPLEYIASL